MEKTIPPVSKAARIGGWIISGLLIAFLLLDAVMKIILDHHSVDGSTALGWPVSAIQGIGVALLAGTVLYAFPKTAVIGAIILTGYLGGALATMIHAGQPMYFVIVFLLLVWTGLCLRDAKAKALLF